MGKSKVLVTGSSGFLGESLCNRLVKDNTEVVGLDRISPPGYLRKKIKSVEGDIKNLSLINYLCKDVDTIFHCAALVPICRASYYEYMFNNAINTMNLLILASLNKVKKFIYISSSAVYGIPEGEITEHTRYKPIEDYGFSKMCAEYFCKATSNKQEYMNIIVVRPRTIIGENRVGMMDLLFPRVLKNKSVYIIGDGSNKFQLLSLRDCVKFLMKVYYNEDVVNEDYNIGTDKYTTLKEDLEKFISKVGSTSEVVCLPKFTSSILGILDKLRLSPMTSWHYKTIDKDFYFDISKAKSTGWKPEDSNVDMLVNSYNWYKDNLDKLNGSVHKSKLKKRLLNWI